LKSLLEFVLVLWNTAGAALLLEMLRIVLAQDDVVELRSAGMSAAVK
jgi:hypothetical protein